VAFCSNCGRENADDAQYCNECVIQLAIGTGFGPDDVGSGPFYHLAVIGRHDISIESVCDLFLGGFLYPVQDKQAYCEVLS